METESAKWVSSWALRPDASLRLICLPFAGGSARVFMGWDEALPRDVDVCRVHLPGRDGRLREPSPDRIQPLVDALAEVVRELPPAPYALFGCSLGALLAFELARRIREDGLAPPRHLFVAARAAPHLPDPSPPVHGLSDEDFVSKLREMGGVPDQVVQSAELMALLVPVLKQDFAVCETYRYLEAPPLDCGITSYAGTADAFATPERVAQWGVHTSGAYSARQVEGGHFFIRDEAGAFLAQLSADLRAVARDLSE